MTLRLFFDAIIKVTFGFIVIATLLFLPAGTFDYPNAWLLLEILFIPMAIVGVSLMLKNPELLRRRLQAKEEQTEQQDVIKYSGLMFILGFILAGLDFRFSWFPLPQSVSYAAALVFIIAYALYAEVLRENTYLNRTITVEEGQAVIDTGLYGMVRHPMYSATILLFLSMPLVLGSLIAFLVFLVYPLHLVKRIQNEEELLEAELQGYIEYKQKVKYRLIPFLW